MSNDYYPDQYFDLERDIIAPNRTPPLERAEPVFTPHDSPAPLVPVYPPPSDSSEAEEAGEHRPLRRRRSRKGRTNASLSDGVLIRSLDFDAVEVAALAERHALASASQSEAEEEEEEDEEEHEAESASDRMVVDNELVRHGTLTASERANAIAAAAKDALNEKDGDFPMIDSPESLPGATQVDEIATGHQVLTEQSYLRRDGCLTPPKQTSPQHRCWNTAPPSRQTPLARDGLRLQLPSDQYHEESLMTSPTLGKYTIVPRDPDPEVVLPAMQLSPSPSSPASSPRQKQTLPSLRTTLEGYDSNSPRLPGLSPMFTHHSPPHLHQFGPTMAFPLPPPPPPHTGMSPPAHPPHPPRYVWRTMTVDSSASTSSEYTPSSSAAVSTPASSILTPSPAASSSLHTLTTLPEHETPALSLQEMEEEIALLSKKPAEVSEVSEKSPEHDPLASEASDSIGSYANGVYRCTVQGCVAAPFQTQYLLNSHMNVHSETRTHFCPVEGCPRGPGGQGFKRKNEMIR